MSGAADDVLARGAPGGTDDIGRAEWALRYAILDGRRFSFERHEYLRGLYECESQVIVVQKAAQTGGSVFGIIDSLWAIDTGRARTVMYFFPTAKDVADFSHDRVKPLIAACRRLSSMVTGIDNSGYTQFLNRETGALEASIYYRGMKSVVSTASVPADQIVIDERDKVSTRDYELALKRISHSEKGYRREICTPTIPDYGIDAAFLRSDMRFWTMKCGKCGRHNQPEKTFREDGGPERVLYEKDGEVYLGCAKCGGRLDPSRGEWVADYPGRETAGFHLSQLYSGVVQSGRPVQKALLEDWRTTRYAQDFWNSRVGLPYEDRTTSVTRETLNACDGEHGMKARGEGCTMGVDQGNLLHVVVSAHRGETRVVLWAGILDKFDRLDGLMKAYDVRTCVIDALPNTHSAREFAARFPGRVYLCYYSAGARGGARWNEAARTVSVNRTESLDAALSGYLRREVRLPADPLIEDVFKAQMCNSARKPVRGESDEITGYEWVRRGPDHFRHADNYDQIAASRRGRSLGEILSGISAAPREERAGADAPGGSDSEEITGAAGREEMEKW